MENFWKYYNEGCEHGVTFGTCAHCEGQGACDKARQIATEWINGQLKLGCPNRQAVENWIADHTPAVCVQCHICKEWHKLEPAEVELYVNQEHEGVPWTCPECQQ